MAWNQQGQWAAPAAHRPAMQRPITPTPAAMMARGGAPVPRVITPTNQALAGGPEAYVVTTRGGDADEVVVKTLVGTFLEEGNNHGRKVFKKMASGNGDVDVFMYYWDSRDGPAFEGWWFGNKLGGTQVWSHCIAASMTPPPTGWKIPWDGAVRPTLMVQKKAQAAQMAPAGASNLGGQKLQEVGAAVKEASNSAREAIAQAKAAIGNSEVAEELQAAERMLQPQVTVLQDALRKLLEGQRGATGEVARTYTQMGTQLRTLQTQLNGELAKVRAGRVQAESAEKNRALDDRDLLLLQELMPEATSKTEGAEDAVEKAKITAELIAAGGEELDEVRQAVTQTEQAANEAQKSIGEARIFLNAKLASTRRYESVRVKEQATAELGKLQVKLQEAQLKLNPLKTCRQDFLSRTAAKKLVQEVMEKLSPAEVEVDRAEEATAALLNEETASKELMNAANAACAKANDYLAAVARFIDSKKQVTAGLAREEIMKLDDRCKASLKKLMDLKLQHKEATEKVGCELVLKEAEGKLQAVAESVTKAADSEGPFLMGVEELPVADTLACVKACETASTAANTAVSIARMFIATKLVEAKRLAPSLSEETTAKLKELQARLNAHSEKLLELKKSTAERKKQATMREAESEVCKAEELVKRVVEAAGLLGDDAKLLDSSASDMRTAADDALKAEVEANTALAEARRYITQRQIDAKGKEMAAEVSAELLKFQTRLTAAQAEVTKYKKLCASVELRLAEKKCIEDAGTKAQHAQEKVAKVVELVEALGAEAAGEGAEAPGAADRPEKQKATRAAEQAAAEAKVAITSALRYVESHTRSPGVAQEAISKLTPELEEALGKLEATVAVMKVKAEKITVDLIVTESTQRVKEAEEAVEKVSEAEAPSAKSDDLPVDEASKALSDLESLVQAAHTSVGGAKTFLAMKRLAAKRLSEQSVKTASDALGELQARLEAAAKRLTETKRGMAERKLATVKREVAEKVVVVEEKVKQAAAATKELADGVGKMGPEDMKAACEKAGTAQHAAAKDLSATRELLLSRQKDVSVIAADSAMLADIKKMLDKLAELQADLDKEKALLRDQEHKFVAQRLLKDATDMIDALEAKLEAVTAAAEPLTTGVEDWASADYLAAVVDMLRQHVKKTSGTPKSFLEKVGSGGLLTEAQFVQCIEGLPEHKELKESALSDDQLKAAFRRMDVKGGGKVSVDEVMGHFVSRFMCKAVVSMTETIAVKGGKQVRKLDIGEVVETNEEPQKEETVGLLRLKAKAEIDGKEGYITLAGNQGTVYLEPYSPLTACQRKIERVIKECSDSSREATKYLEQKTEELKSVKTGPLAETKADLQTMKSRVAKVKSANDVLRKQVGEAEKKHREAMEAEQKKRREAGDRKAATIIVDEVTALTGACDEAVAKAVAPAEALASSRGAAEADPLKAMDQAAADLEAAAASVAEAQAKIKAHFDSVKAATKGPFSECRSTLIKLKVKAGALESRCKKHLAALGSAKKLVSHDALLAVKGALRAHAMEKGVKADDLFAQLGGKDGLVPPAALRKFVEQLPGLSLKAAQLDLAFGRLAAGVAKGALAEMAQEFQRCVKDIAITSAFVVKGSKTLRKLAPGELIEVLEGVQVDEATGLTRVRCRALLDLREGWTTLQGNQGSLFMEAAGKPYLCCEEAAALSSAFESTSQEVRRVEPGEVFEVLEGPRKEDPLECVRIRGKCPKDGKIGWCTLKDAAGVPNLELARLLVCKSSIAITTTFDIGAGKAIRKLEQGETLEILEGPEEDKSRGLLRVKAKATTDDKEGWVTMKGNQGTSYAEESRKHYVVKRGVPLEKSTASDSATIRMLEVGEALELTDGPKTETKEGCHRVRGRSLAGGAEGWLTVTAKSFQPWAPRLRVAQASVLGDVVAIKEAKTVRKLEADEVVEVLEAPALEKESGAIRVRVIAEKDGVMGFATVRGNQGTVMLKPILDEKQ